MTIGVQRIQEARPASASEGLMELKINKVQYEVTDPDELRLLLAQVRRTQFSEVWMQHPAGWPAIGALSTAKLPG